MLCGNGIGVPQDCHVLNSVAFSCVGDGNWLPGYTDLQNISYAFYHHDFVLQVPIMLERLHKLWNEKQEELRKSLDRPFAGIGKESRESVIGDVPNHTGILPLKSDTGKSPEKKRARRGSICM